MQILVQKADSKKDIIIIKITGDIDTSTIYEIETTFAEIIESRCYKIIVDLEEVIYISSAGWSIFLNYIKEIRQKGGDLKLIGMKSFVYKVFKLLELSYILKDYNTLENAISDFNLFSDETRMERLG